MAEERLPGPIGLDHSLAPDPGTLARNRSTLPGSTGVDNTRPAMSPPEQRPCPCTGQEQATIEGLPEIPGYSGELPSPLQMMWYVPEGDEAFKLQIPDREIRGWIRNAATYHGIPHVLLAIILQQENAPTASKLHQLAQFIERSLTTFAAIVDKHLYGIAPDFIARGSSGFANMSRATLLDAARYTETLYCKNPLSGAARYRIFGWDQDTRIAGDDWRADLYYSAAHLRQLIDRVTGQPCFNGALSLEQLRRVIAGYNGSGPLAEKYADDAMATLTAAAKGEAKLYFYEK